MHSFLGGNSIPNTRESELLTWDDWNSLADAPFLLREKTLRNSCAVQWLLV
jgi:hypothetical protein